jgi:signal transduction histidine kinase
MLRGCASARFRYSERVPPPPVDPDASHALQELDLIRRRVIAVIGHELRTPVTTLRGLASQLASAQEDEIRDVLAPGLERNTARLESLLDDLLIASDITTALPVGDPRPVEVGAVARSVWHAMAPGEPLDLEGRPECAVAVREDALERILRHLFDNARKYGRPPITVYVRPDIEGRIEIDVHSPGDPLAGADLDLAFELFYRGERAVTSSPGLGIGLPAARALARQDGGDLRLAPRARGGVVMHLVLPPG